MNEVTAQAEPKDRFSAKHAGNGLTALSTTAVREACNDLAATLANVGASPEGLVESDAAERLDEVGPNEIAREKPPHWLFQLLACFKNCSSSFSPSSRSSSTSPIRTTCDRSSSSA